MDQIYGKQKRVGIRELLESRGVAVSGVQSEAEDDDGLLGGGEGPGGGQCGGNYQSSEDNLGREVEVGMGALGLGFQFHIIIIGHIRLLWEEEEEEEGMKC